jgi:hypothetical protein
METQNVTADAEGNYSVQLGATKPRGLPLDLFSSGEARWLGVRINNGEEQPRVLLLSVPYALKAADAETVGGLPPSAFVLAAPPTAAGPSNDASANRASNGVTAAVTGTGTTVCLPKTPSELKTQRFRAFMRSWCDHDELSFRRPFRFCRLQFSNPYRPAGGDPRASSPTRGFPKERAAALAPPALRPALVGLALAMVARLAL